MDRDGGTDRRRGEQKERLGQGEMDGGRNGGGGGGGGGRQTKGKTRTGRDRQERWTEGKTRIEEHEACTLCLSENL